MRRRRVALAAVLASLVAAAAAPAKSAVTATLDDPAALERAPAGARITLTWTQDGTAMLPVPDGASGRNVRSLGVYVRLRGGAGGAPIEVPARPAAPVTAGLPAGRYVAHATVPAGGIAAVAITVQGLRSRRGAAPVRAAVAPSEILVANDPFTVAAAGDDAGTQVPWAALALWLAAMAILAAAWRALAARRLAA